MTTINNTYINSLLADATYVHDIDPALLSLSGKTLEQALTDRMTAVQARTQGSAGLFTTALGQQRHLSPRNH